MKKHWKSLLPIYVLVLCSFVGSALLYSKAVSAITETRPLRGRRTFVIDAGHGGIDGGATSCSGKLESAINLEISLRLCDLLHLLGMQTDMIRTEDISIYTEGTTIAAKKVSDLKARVKRINSRENAVLVSIHQNHFSAQQYKGAQIFYAATPGSRLLAEKLQQYFVSTLNIGSNRKCKPASGIYLMENISCTGILVECGFLSNPMESALLEDTKYQQRVCCVIASACSSYESADAA